MGRITKIIEQQDPFRDGGVPDPFEAGGVPTPNPRPKRPTGTSPAILKREFSPDGSLTRNMRRNYYVREMQRAFNFPPKWLTGNYLNHTTDAVKNFIQDNVPDYSDKTGEYVNRELYDMIVGGKKATTTTDTATTKTDTTTSTTDNTTTKTDNTTTNDNSRNSSSGYSRPDKPEFPFMLGAGDPKEGYNPATWGELIGNLQISLNGAARTLGGRLQQTNILDIPTIEKVRAWYENDKIKKFIHFTLDTRDLSLLNSTTMPGLTPRVYNGVINSAQLIISHNSAVDSSKQIHEMVNKLLNEQWFDSQLHQDLKKKAEIDKSNYQQKLDMFKKDHQDHMSIHERRELLGKVSMALDMSERHASDFKEKLLDLLKQYEN